MAFPRLLIAAERRLGDLCPKLLRKAPIVVGIAADVARILVDLRRQQRHTCIPCSSPGLDPGVHLLSPPLKEKVDTGSGPA
jgi:hypothetical protein